MKTVSIVGARPQFVKLAPVSRAMRRARLQIDDLIVHTGQHYDDSMSRVFFEELDIPRPHVNLGVGSAPQGAQTARMLEAIEAYLAHSRPDAVIVYGDTNSTLAGALAAAKMHIPVAHVEAGLRSFNRRMPEELNRVATDHLSEMLFAPTKTAMGNLAVEGLKDKALLTGDVMYDAVLFCAAAAHAQSSIIADLKLAPGGYGIATIHRAENTTPEELGTLLRAINDAASRFGRIVFPMHPRTTEILQSKLPDWRPAAALMVTAPLGYLDMLALLQGANWVLTDSGGLQKEAFFLNCPCVTLRNETEWVETLQGHANCLAGSDAGLLAEKLAELTRRPGRTSHRPPAAMDGPFGGGDAAERIVEAVCLRYESHR
ncbi:MAG: UDP-N-acetylglucosamine 2-epimerase (non-hydrolyzing) [Steroidobacteraceae bacterium]